MDGLNCRFQDHGIVPCLDTRRAPPYLPTMKFILLFAVGGLLVGCHPPSKRTVVSNRTVDEFSFLELGMSINVVTNRLGQPDRGYRGQYRLRYDLADGTEMVITAHDVSEFEPDAQRVYWFGQSRDGNWLWSKEMTGDLTLYLHWTNGTPVTVHLFAGETARGSLVDVSTNTIQVRDSLSNTTNYNRDSVLWVEKDTQ